MNTRLGEWRSGGGARPLSQGCFGQEAMTTIKVFIPIQIQMSHDARDRMVEGRAGNPDWRGKTGGGRPRVEFSREAITPTHTKYAAGKTKN